MLVDTDRFPRALKSEMELPQEVQDSIDQFESKLNELEKLMAPVFKADFHTLLSQLTPLEAAKMHVTMAYALNTLFYSMLDALVTLLTPSVPENPRPLTSRPPSVQGSRETEGVHGETARIC